MTESDDLLFRSGEPFATGVARYLDAFPGLTEPLARIYVKLLPQGAKTAVLALLDTGGHYCILNSEVADSIRNRLTERIGERKLQTAHGVVRGELYLHTITVMAERGSHLDVDANVFVVPDWQGPSVLGYAGVLDRLRFAVDPATNRFHFAALD